MGILDDVRKRQAELDANEARATRDDSMADMLAAERKEIEWVIPQMLPVGLGLIIGKPKTGKSFLALDLAISSWLGELVLGQEGSLEPTDVLYINLEETSELVMERVDLMGVVGGPKNGAAVTLDWRWSADLTGNGPLADLREWFEAHARPGRRLLVIIDTWAKWCNLATPELRGLNAYERDVKLFSPVQGMAREFHAAIVAIFHQKKSSKFDSDDVFESISGSMGSVGSADCIWHLNRPSREEPEATLTVGGRMIRGERAYAIHFDSDTVTWLLRGVEDEVVTSEMREVLTVLDEGVDEGLTLAQLHAELLCERFALRKRLQRMRTKGLIRPQGKRPRTKWQISATGELYIRRPTVMENPRKQRGKPPETTPKSGDDCNGSIGDRGGVPYVSPMDSEIDKFDTHTPIGDRVGDTPIVPIEKIKLQDNQALTSIGDIGDTLVSSLSADLLTSPVLRKRNTNDVSYRKNGGAHGSVAPDGEAEYLRIIEARLRTVVGPFCERAGVGIGEFLLTLEGEEWEEYLDDFEADPKLVGRVIATRLAAGTLTARASG